MDFISTVGAMVTASMISGACSYLWCKAVSSIIPGKTKDKNLNFKLQGKTRWHKYFLAEYDMKGLRLRTPSWVRAEDTLTIKKNMVKGISRLTDYDTFDNCKEYEIHGQIRADRMLLIDCCIGEPTDFSSITLTNLGNEKRLIGVYVTSGGKQVLKVRPVILVTEKENPLSCDSLNEELQHLCIDFFCPEVVSFPLLHGTKYS